MKKSISKRIRNNPREICSILLLVFITNQCYPSIACNHFSNELSKKDIVENKLFPGYCTIFSVTEGESVYFGNNEDWKNPLTYIWVEPSTDDNYAIVYLGFDNFFPQGGINEKGLAFDGNALPYTSIDTFPERLQPTDAIVNNIIMQKCATVEEAINMASSYDWGKRYNGRFAGQFLLADSTGDAVVIGFGEDGELAFTRKSKGNGYIVSTNFNRAYTQNRYGGYPCRRYNIASKMLQNVKSEEDLSIEFLASILDAVHEEGKTLNTLYSNIFDLKHKIIHLYYWHQFDQVISIDFTELRTWDSEPIRIESLFNEKTVSNAKNEHKRYQVLNMKTLSIIALAISSLGFLIYILRKKVFVKK